RVELFDTHAVSRFPLVSAQNQWTPPSETRNAQSLGARTHGLAGPFPPAALRVYCRVAHTKN
ncbi:MAG: hypothetical protein O7B26_02790, partial [Planctomycetota bacterium]|nr:hypothetical protein [Planctomycetota bacterium]